MTNAADIFLIRNRFAEIIASDMPFIYDNEPPIERPTDIWGRFTVRPGESMNRDIERQTFKQRGWMYLQVFVPQGMGDADGWVIAEKVGKAFRNWRSDDYTLRVNPPSYDTSKAEEDYFMILVKWSYEVEHKG